VTRGTQTQVFRALSAAILAFLGWIGTQNISYIDAVPGLGIFLGIIAMPGILVGIIFDFATSHGLHDNETFAWVVFPSNVILYFIFFALMAKLVRGLREVPGGTRN
jgi:hypothetical protein